MKDTKVDMNKWKHIPHILIKKTQYHQHLNCELIHTFISTLTKTLIKLFSIARQRNYKVHLKKETRKNSQKNPDKKKSKGLLA